MFPLAVLERDFTHDHFASTANTSADFARISFSADSFADFLALMIFFFLSISPFRSLSSCCFAFTESSSISFSADSFAAFLALMTFFFASISLFRDLSSFCFAFIDSSSISFASASVFSASLIAALSPAIFSFCDFTASSAAL